MQTSIFFKSSQAINPILIIDKKGALGVALFQKLKEENLCVLVSSISVSQQKNLIHIAYKKKLPSLPDNKFSAIFIYYNGEKELEKLIPAFIAKAKQDNCTLFLTTSIYKVNKEFVDGVAGNESCKVILVGDLILGEGFGFSSFDQILDDVVKSGRIDLRDEGLLKGFPVYVWDAADKIFDLYKYPLKLPYKYKLFSLFGKDSITHLSFIRLLKRVHPDVSFEIGEKRTVRQEAVFVPLYAHPLLPLNYSIETVFKKLNFKILKDKTKVKKRKRFFKRTIRNLTPLFVLLSFLIFTFFSYILTSLILLGLGTTLVASSELFIDQAPLASQIGSRTAYKFLDLAQSSSQSPLLDKVDFAQNISSWIWERAQKESRRALYDSVLSASILEWKNLEEGKNTTPMPNIFSAVLFTKTAINKWQQENLQDKTASFIFSGAKESILTLANFIQSLPSLLGGSGTKTYCLLLANSQLATAGGGVVDAYALITFRNSAIINFKVYTASLADRKLLGSVEPPFALRRYKNIKKWNLKESNVDISFLQNAQNVSFFLSHELGVKTDGVILVDTNEIKNILAVLGPVYLRKQHLWVNSVNFEILNTQHILKHQEFITPLFSSMVDSLSLNLQKTEKLSEFISRGLTDKDILVALPNSSYQSVFTANDYSAIPFASQDASFFGVSELELDNKALSFSIQRSLSEQASVSAEGDVSYSQEFDLYNKTDFAYKDYVSFVLPKDAVFEGITIDGKEMKTTDAIIDPSVYEKDNFVAPNALEVEEKTYPLYQTVSFPVSIDPQTTKTLAISYSEKKDVKSLSFNFIVLKQPGIPVYANTLIFTYPSNFSQVGYKFSGKVQENLDKDLLYKRTVISR